MIPEQVRLLRSLLAGREARMLRVVLAGEREGTFTTRSRAVGHDGNGAAVRARVG